MINKVLPEVDVLKASNRDLETFLKAGDMAEVQAQETLNRFKEQLQAAEASGSAA